MTIDPSMLDFLAATGRTTDDLFCRDCGKQMISDEVLASLRYHSKMKSGKPFKRPFVKSISDSKPTFIESDEDRWIINGKKIGDRKYHRHICWDCLFKKIPHYIEHNSEFGFIDKRSLPQWVRLLKNGALQSTLRIPPACISPVWWFMLVFDVTLEDLNKARSQFDTASLASFIRRHGEKEGRVKYEEYCKLQARAGCTLDYFIEKYGKEEGQHKYDEVCANKCVTLDNCIRKYGEEKGIQFFAQYCKKQAYVGNKLEYFIEKYGLEEGTKKYYEVCQMKVLSLDNFIRKYGPEEGKEKYAAYMGNTKTGYSVISQEMFAELDKLLGDAAAESKWATKNLEKELSITVDGHAKLARLDYCLGNKVIEFNGDFWHANPNMYAAEDVVHLKDKPTTAQEIWTRNKKRLDAIRSCGYDVLVIWEHDYVTDKSLTLETCVRFLSK